MNKLLEIERKQDEYLYLCNQLFKKNSDLVDKK